MRLESTCKPRKSLGLFASLFASQLSFQLSTLSSLGPPCPPSLLHFLNCIFYVFWHVFLKTGGGGLHHLTVLGFSYPTFISCKLTIETLHQRAGKVSSFERQSAVQEHRQTNGEEKRPIWRKGRSILKRQCEEINRNETRTFNITPSDCMSCVFYLRNRKHFSCFHTVIETPVEVWENEKLKWEHEPVGRVFQRYFEFSQTSTSVSFIK